MDCFIALRERKTYFQAVAWQEMNKPAGDGGGRTRSGPGTLRFDSGVEPPRRDRKIYVCGRLYFCTAHVLSRLGNAATDGHHVCSLLSASCLAGEPGKQPSSGPFVGPRRTCPHPQAHHFHSGRSCPWGQDPAVSRPCGSAVSQPQRSCDSR